jgi:uncharacterized protein DUF4236
MPVRFRRTFTLFPGVKVNVSKGGMSITVGRKGFHLNFSKHGVRQTTGLPGSGISHTSYLIKNDDEDDEDSTAKADERPTETMADEKPKRQRKRRTVREQASSPWGFFLFVFVALFFIYFGANAFGLLPPNLLTNFLSTMTEWARQVGL